MNDASAATDERLVRLPDGRMIQEINAYETKFLFKEIFADRRYLQNGITLSDGDVVFDVGANIGLFSLFCLDQAAVKVYAFEPAPHCIACMRRNLAAVKDAVEIVDAALTDTDGPLTFTYYPHYSIMSSLKADAAFDAETLRRGVRKQLPQGTDPARAARMVELHVGGKLQDPVEFTCSGYTISSVLRRYQVPRIDLLKIDVEKAEAMVLAGIAPADWSCIRQIIVEVHDFGNAEHEAMATQLRSHGFRTVVEASDDLSDSAIYNLYATR